MRRLAAPALAGVAAVLPLLAPFVWEPGYPRLALQSSIALAAISPLEQPLTVRTFVGAWVALLVVGWFALAYAGRKQRSVALWEVGLVLGGAALALPRLGNVWVAAALFLPALARRAGLARHAAAPTLTAACCLVATVASLVVSRPAPLPPDVLRAVQADAGQGSVFAYWRWSNTLADQLDGQRQVLGSGDLHGASEEAWTDYLRVSLAHARWADVLRADQADLLVLDAQSSQSLTADLVRQSPEWQVLFDGQGALVARRNAA